MNAFTPIPTTFIPLTPQLRRRIEETIEQLVAILDAFDGDPDLEQSAGDFGELDVGDDREPEEDFEPGEDEEPSLGWTIKTSGGDSFRAPGTAIRVRDEFDFEGSDPHGN